MTPLRAGPEGCEDPEPETTQLVKADPGRAPLSGPLEDSAPAPPLGVLVGLAACARSPPQALVHGALILNQFLFSMLHITSKPALAHIPPLCFATLRLSMAVPLLGLAGYLERGFPDISTRDVALLMAMGVVGVSVPQTLIFVGNELAGPAVISIMQPTIPVWTSLLAALLRQEHTSFLKAMGIALSVGGALVLLGVWSLDFQDSTTAGTLVMVFQTSSYAAFLVALSRFLRRVPRPFAAFFYCSLAGLTVCGALAVRPFLRTSWRHVPTTAWLAVAWAGIVTSFVAHSLNSWAVSHAAAVVPAVYTTLQPVCTVVLSSIFLGERILARHLGGFALILSGLAVMARAKLLEDRRAKRAKLASGADLRAMAADDEAPSAPPSVRFQALHGRKSGAHGPGSADGAEGVGLLGPRGARDGAWAEGSWVEGSPEARGGGLAGWHMEGAVAVRGSDGEGPRWGGGEVVELAARRGEG